jgi:hypothetical protein
VRPCVARDTDGVRRVRRTRAVCHCVALSVRCGQCALCLVTRTPSESRAPARDSDGVYAAHARRMPRRGPVRTLWAMRAVGDAGRSPCDSDGVHRMPRRGPVRTLWSLSCACTATGLCIVWAITLLCNYTAVLLHRRGRCTALPSGAIAHRCDCPVTALSSCLSAVTRKAASGARAVCRSAVDAQKRFEGPGIAAVCVCVCARAGVCARVSHCGYAVGDVCVRAYIAASGRMLPRVGSVARRRPAARDCVCGRCARGSSRSTAR